MGFAGNTIDLIADYHIHTAYSCDAQTSMDEMCQAAIQAGIREVGFSDHYDLHPLEEFREHLDLGAWWDSFQMCKAKYEGQLILRAGVEVGEPHLFPEKVQALISNYPWDFILGSLHWVGDNSVFDSRSFEDPEDHVYRAYFEELMNLVTHGEFDILAHFDVIKRYGFEVYGPFYPERYEDLIRPILARLAANQRSLEINSATMRRSIDRPSPDRTIVRWFIEEGGQYLTLGSDAHLPQDIGFGFELMKSLVSEQGIQGLAQYSGRTPTLPPG